MRFDLSEEQQDLQGVVRDLLEKSWPRTELTARIGASSEHDPVWEQLVGLDLLGLLVPEEQGGSGASSVELAVVARELGRALHPGPYISSALALAVLADAHDPAIAEVTAEVLRRGTRVAIVGFDPTEDVRLEATDVDGAMVISGHALNVLGADSAQAFVVVASTGARGRLFWVDDMSHVSVDVSDQLDIGRPVPSVRFSRAQATEIVTDREVRETVERVALVAQVALAAEQIGGAETCLDIAVEYAKQRIQFGQPIGSFQAIKHRCATTAVAIEAARAAMWNAAWEASHDAWSPQVVSHAGMARAASTEAFVASAESAIQVLGGIGFTWDYPVHLYYRRALVSRVLFGSPRHHRELVARSLFGQ